MMAPAGSTVFKVPSSNIPMKKRSLETIGGEEVSSTTTKRRASVSSTGKDNDTESEFTLMADAGASSVGRRLSISTAIPASLPSKPAPHEVINLDEEDDFLAQQDEKKKVHPARGGGGGQQQQQQTYRAAGEQNETPQQRGGQRDKAGRGRGRGGHGSAGRGGGGGGGQQRKNVVCRDFLAGSCKFGGECHFSHQIDANMNGTVAGGGGGGREGHNRKQNQTPEIPHISQSFVRSAADKQRLEQQENVEAEAETDLELVGSSSSLELTDQKETSQEDGTSRNHQSPHNKQGRTFSLQKVEPKQQPPGTPVIASPQQQRSAARKQKWTPIKVDLHAAPETPVSTGSSADGNWRKRDNTPRTPNQGSIKIGGSGAGRSESGSRNYSSPSGGRNGRDRDRDRNIYLPHFAKVKVEAGLESGALRQGLLRINKKNRYDAYVRFEGTEDDDVFIAGIKNQNRALDGDLVVIRLLEGAELEKETRFELEKKRTKAAQNQERQAKVNFFEAGDDEEEFSFEDKRVYGAVVSIVDSPTRSQSHVGTLCLDKPNLSPEEQSTQVGRYVWFRPNDKRVPFLLIPSQVIPAEVLRQKDNFPTTLYTAQITGWTEISMYPLGSYTGHLGQMGELRTESEALLVAAGITWDDFSDPVLDSLVATPWSIPEEEIAKRVDLRKERIFSIDPPTARDLDDAVSVKDLGDGTYELGVHIADVSYFVSPGTEVDKEAYNRATSVYLVQKVIPMLPRLLCEELCSLNSGVDRLAFSVFWTVDEDANVLDEPRFARSVINSCAKLWYDHAQAVIEGRDWNDVNPVTLSGDWTDEQVHGDIRVLFKFSQKLRQRRYETGSLTLNSIKLWFSLDEFGNPINSGVYEQKEANKLIEEFMLMANMAVARKICTDFPEASLLRRHPPALQKALEEIVETLGREGIAIDPTSAGTLHASLEAIEDPTKQMLSRLLMIKGMKRAEYFCSGSSDIATFSHYALNVPYYTHFTSPIRRYCDLVVHRLLDAAIKNEPAPFTTSKINDTSRQCNVRKNSSKDAQDSSSDLFLCAYLSKIQVETDSPEGILADGWINGIGSRAFDVLIPMFGIEGRVWLEDSMEKGQVAGVESVPESTKLKIFWKRSHHEHDHSVKAADKSEEPDQANYLTQIVGMFDSIRVLIVTDMQKSPPMYKLYAMAPPELDPVAAAANVFKNLQMADPKDTDQARFEDQGQ